VVEGLTSWTVSEDGDRIRLGFEDGVGRRRRLDLPSDAVGSLLPTIPRILLAALRAWGNRGARVVQPLGAWRVERAAHPGRLILTLSTPSGFDVAFAVAPHQLAAMSEAADSAATPQDVLNSGPSATADRAGKPSLNSQRCSATRHLGAQHPYSDPALALLRLSGRPPAGPGAKACLGWAKRRARMSLASRPIARYSATSQAQGLLDFRWRAPLCSMKYSVGRRLMGLIGWCGQLGSVGHGTAPELP
jgi:hypothetical protein